MLLLIVSVVCVILVYKLFLEPWYRKPLVSNVLQKTVFITGTDSGFGRFLALHLDGMGVKVYAGCYTESGAEDLQKSASEKMKILNIDVTDVTSIQKAKDIVEKDLLPGQGLWGVVNNAGIHRGLFIGLTTVEDFRAVMEVNFFGVLNVNNIFGPLVQKAHGRIVNVGSILGRCRGCGEPYIGSKAALLAYNDGLRCCMKVFGVHVAIIEPGYHQTDITKESFLISDIQRSWDKLPKNLQDLYGEQFISAVKKDISYWCKHFPLSKFNKVENVVNAITHALLAKRPKDRYVVAYDYCVYALAMYSPDWLFDAFFMKFFGNFKLLRKNVLKYNQ